MPTKAQEEARRVKVSQWYLDGVERDARRWRRLAGAARYGGPQILGRLAVVGAVAGGWAALLHVCGVVS